MNLNSGTKLGQYEILATIGAGGMGEVYSAYDLNLNRKVALKFLPDTLAGDAERIARFEREAKLLASLNHPGIAAIYGLEQAEGNRFIVMELVEGETLAQRLTKGPLPIEEALGLCLQIAEALEATHEKGVIHRDLKPANVMISEGDKVKILDFGLAKSMFDESQSDDASRSPTITEAMTRPGSVLGTAAYMSPEQAMGKAVDRRADIWAFGVVLFEMLTGQKLFTGETASETLAAVMMRDPDFSKLPQNLHPKILEALKRCLEKELKNRYSGISDARVDIQEALTDPSGVYSQSVQTVKIGKKLQVGIMWIAATAILCLIVAGITVWKLKPIPSPEPGQVTRFEYQLPEGRQFSDLTYSVLAISPDGKQIAYCTNKGIYLRSMDQLVAKMIPGTEKNTVEPLFSPDGKWIGYFSFGDKKWKKIPVSGGTPVILCDATFPLNASWGADNQIVYAEYEKGIMRISANGGTPELIIKKTGLYLVNPQVLPDGKTVLFGIVRDHKTFQIAVQSLKSGNPRILLEGGNGRYLSTGHIIYCVRNSLFAVPFNLERLEVSGSPVRAVVNVFRLNGIYTPQYAVSDSGTLVYITGTRGTLHQRTLVWVDRNGKEEAITAPPNLYDDFRISPDGTKVAVQVQLKDIWIWDLIRKTLSRLTFDAPYSDGPLWTPDGKRVAYLSRHDNVNGVYWKAADGTGKEEPLNTEGKYLHPESWSGDKKTIVAYELSALSNGRHSDIGTFSLEGDSKWHPLLKENSNQVQPRLSPDGRWLAYVSDESGRYEVYVRPFPDVDNGRWQVSTSGGNSPLWSRNGKELFYRNGDAVMAVSVKIDPNLNFETPRALFNGKYVSFDPQETVGGEVDTWDISPDGRQFLMIKEDGTGAGERPSKINIVVNWFEELKKRMSASK